MVSDFNWTVANGLEDDGCGEASLATNFAEAKALGAAGAVDDAEEDGAANFLQSIKVNVEIRKYTTKVYHNELFSHQNSPRHFEYSASLQYIVRGPFHTNSWIRLIGETRILLASVISVFRDLIFACSL